MRAVRVSRRHQDAPSVGWFGWFQAREWYTVATREPGGSWRWAPARQLTSSQAIEWRLDVMETLWDAEVAQWVYRGGRWIRV